MRVRRGKVFLQGSGIRARLCVCGGKRDGRKLRGAIVITVIKRTTATGGFFILLRGLPGVEMAKEYKSNTVDFDDMVVYCGGMCVIN